MGYRADSQNVTTQADGGYLVPTVIEKAIVEKMVDVAPIRQFATVISNAPALSLIHIYCALSERSDVVR